MLPSLHHEPSIRQASTGRRRAACSLLAQIGLCSCACLLGRRRAACSCSCAAACLLGRPDTAAGCCLVVAHSLGHQSERRRVLVLDGRRRRVLVQWWRGARWTTAATARVRVGDGVGEWKTGCRTGPLLPWAVASWAVHCCASYAVGLGIWKHGPCVVQIRVQFIFGYRITEPKFSYKISGTGSFYPNFFSGFSGSGSGFSGSGFGYRVFYPVLAVGLQFPGAIDNPPCGTGQSGVPPDSPLFSAGRSASDYTSNLGLCLILVDLLLWSS